MDDGRDGTEDIHHTTTHEFEYNNNVWTILEDTNSNLNALETLLHSTTVLEKNGYLLHQPTDVDLELKRKCLNCHSKSAPTHYSHQEFNDF